MKIRVLLITWALLVFHAPLYSQNSVFGKNKVQYRKFEWQFIQSHHFDVYFAQHGYDLAVFTAEAAEEAYESIKKLFRYEITDRISIVVHNSHNEFQQTNVIGEYLDEGIGGVTELFKNRIVVPFEGDYRQFRHVIHHELVHAVLNDMFYGGSIQSLLASRTPLVLPLWFNEGLAEFTALSWDTNSDMFMRDATINNYVPPIDYLGGYFAYRGGQSVWYYINVKYGQEKIGEILNRIRATRSVDQGFRAAIGLSVKELSERWQKDLKVIYWPDISDREDPVDYARRLTNHRDDDNFYNTSPAISPQGDHIAFISDRQDYFSVYVMSAVDGSNVEKVINGQQTADFEELHLLTPGITWSPDGTKIALAVKSGERDAIMIVDIESGDQERLTFNLDGIFSVDWSRDGQKIVFVGLKSPQSDIYVYDFPTKTLTNLTNDIFSDFDPSFSPDGKTVYFTSDRRGYVDPATLPDNFRMINFDFSQTDLYAVSVDTKTVRFIAGSPQSKESSPVPSPDGRKILYISDQNGINNIYVHDLSTGSDRPVTNSLSGVYQLSISDDGSKLVFASMREAGFDIYLLRSPFNRTLDVTELEPTRFIAHPFTATRTQQGRVVSAATPQSSDTVAVRGNIIVVADSTADAAQQPSGTDVDLRNFVFTDRAMQDTSAAQSENVPDLRVDNTRDLEGNFIAKKYKLNFSPDLVYGTAAYSTFYGIEGTTLMAFSDMLGDHQIIFQSNLLLDLKNSDYGLSYYYLPDRIDYGFVGFHSARFLYIGNGIFDNLYRFRQWALGLVMSYPIDRFNRLDLTTLWLNLSRDNLDNPLEPTQRRSFLLPMISYVHDNTLWSAGWFGPTNGSRFNLTFYGSAKYSQNALDLQTLTFDYRGYNKLLEELIFVTRFTGGVSVGKDRQNFFIGGDNGWINRGFYRNQFPIVDVEDYAFLTPVLPLRGYDFNVKTGTHYALANFEFRFPLVRYFILGALPFGFQNILGAAWADVGTAWSDSQHWRAFSRTPSGTVVTNELLMSTGVGARVIFLGLPFRFDVAWRFDWRKLSSPLFMVSLGPEI